MLTVQWQAKQYFLYISPFKQRRKQNARKWFFQASNSIPTQEMDNLQIGPSMLQNFVNAPNTAQGPFMQQSNHSPPNDNITLENFFRTPKGISHFLSVGKEDRQASPQTRNNNVANQTAGASAPEPSQLPELSCWAPTPSADPT